MASISWFKNFEDATESYSDAQRRWPKSKNPQVQGRWILASYDDESIVVYQAYNEEIANYACENGHFRECPGYNQTRMTWIKTNFLWMMYRSSWGTAPNQERILAIWLRRAAFETYLANAVHSSAKMQDERSATASKGTSEGLIRLQWDPDHHPLGQSVEGRRAIQLGLKKIDSFLDGRDILRIVDITPFVQSQYQNAVLVPDRLDQLRIPIEKMYIPQDEQTRLHIRLDPPPVDQNEQLHCDEEEEEVKD